MDTIAIEKKDTVAIEEWTPAQSILGYRRDNFFVRPRSPDLGQHCIFRWSLSQLLPCFALALIPQDLRRWGHRRDNFFVRTRTPDLGQTCIYDGHSRRSLYGFGAGPYRRLCTEDNSAIEEWTPARSKKEHRRNQKEEIMARLT